MEAGRAATAVAGAMLLGLAGPQAAWGSSGSWPLPDRAALADAVAGGEEVPSPAACFAVAGALGAAAVPVGGRPRLPPTVRRLGSAGVVATVALRGLAGLLDGVGLVSLGASSPRFRHLGRRVCSPLCLGLAALAVPSVRAR